MRFLLLSVFVLLGSIQLLSQSHSLKVIARPAKDSIVLRWAPSSQAAWQHLNKYGYRIERYTLVRDTAVLEEKTLKNITTEPIKPKPQNAWMRWIDTDDFVAVAAQAIFGESFQPSSNQSEVASIINTIKESEARYSYALYASDISARAADLSGLRFVDKDVKANEKYLYRIYSMVPENILNIEMGFVFVGPSSAYAMPALQKPVLKFGDKVVQISWPVAAYRDVYTGYYIEKSTDRKLFTKLNSTPYSFIEVNETDQNQIIEKMDSLQSNQDSVYYRVIGITPFGEMGNPSSVSGGKGEETFAAVASRLKGQVLLDGKVELIWEVSQEKQNQLKGFEVERSSTTDTGFENVSGSLPPTTRRFIDIKPRSVNYYRLTSISMNGQHKVSFPILVQLEDSIPPVKPTALRISIDTSGVASLTWNANAENDLLGYRVFRSNFKSAEFSQVTVGPVEATEFTDTLNVFTLSKKAYYKIAAVDNRFNTSEYSDVVEVIKPDIVPPVPPVIQSVENVIAGVKIKWIASSSEDVAGYRLFRKSKTSWNWVLAKNLTKSDSMYVDELEDTDVYQYHLVAIDAAGLTSAPTPTITGKSLGKEIAGPVKQLKAEADREKKWIQLSWTTKATNIKSYLLYRSATGEPLTLYKTLPPSINQFQDTKVLMNSEYIYRIKAVYTDGNESRFSEEVKVKY